MVLPAQSRTTPQSKSLNCGPYHVLRSQFGPKGLLTSNVMAKNTPCETRKIGKDGASRLLIDLVKPISNKRKRKIDNP